MVNDYNKHGFFSKGNLIKLRFLFVFITNLFVLPEKNLLFLNKLRYNDTNFSGQVKNDPSGHFFAFKARLFIFMDIQSILNTTLPGLGYECVDFELTPQGTLRVFIDKPEGITVEDCATVSNHLSRVFLVEEVDYKNLEISSPGLDRPLKKVADFVRFNGSLVKLKTRLPIDGQKNFIGRIGSFDEQTHMLTLVVDDKDVFIELDNIDKARIKPEFKF